jgi:hypothetical protein
MIRTESCTYEVGSHLEVFNYTAPKNYRAAVVKNMKKFVPWFEKNGIRIDYYRFGNSDIVEGMESIAKTLSTAEDEDVWIELQYFRDYTHWRNAYAKMMQGRSPKLLRDEFFGLVTQGKSLVTGGFERLRQ